MIEVVETGLDLVGDLTGDVGIREMTLDAGKLLVGGNMPAVVDMVHAVAGAADPGVSGGVKPDEIDANQDRTGKETEGEQLDGGKAQKVFPVHAGTI